MAPQNQKISKSVRDALEFFKFDKVPSSKVLYSKYRAEAAKVHPDKNNDSNESKEAFQELQRQLNVLVDYVKKNDVSKDVLSDEERESREFFENFNWDIRNIYSVTTLIPTDLAPFWKPVLVEEFGDPAVNNAKEGNPGLKFTNRRNSKNIFITLWDDPANGDPKLLIQSGSQALIDEFVKKDKPRLIKKVWELSPKVLGDSGGEAAQPEDLLERHRQSKYRTCKGKDVKNVTKMKSKCDLCCYMAKDEAKMNQHININHKSPEDRFNSNRDLNMTVGEANQAQNNDGQSNMESGADKTANEEEYDGMPVDDDDEEIQLNNEWLSKIEDLEKKIKETESLLAEKVIVIEMVKKKNEELDKANKDMKRRVDNVNVDMESRTKELREIQNENVKLKAQCQFTEEVKIHNNDLKIINTRLEQDLEKAKRKYDQLCEREKNVEPDDDIIDIEVLARNKYSGFRRQPGGGPQPAPARPVGNNVFKCSGCDFVSNRKEVLSCHITQVHKRCDLCSELLNNDSALRDHLRLVHKKYNGTLLSCMECDFSALSKQHLRKHMDKHHKVAQKIQKTCRHWRDGVCHFGLNCKFQHRVLWCKFGAQCRDVNNCRFEHSQRRTNVRNVSNTRPNEYTQPRFTTEEFPFLGKQHQQQHNQPPQHQCHCQQVWPMRRPGV